MLGDLLFMLQDYEAALSIYKLLVSELKVNDLLGKIL